MPDAFSARSLAWRHSRMPAAKSRPWGRSAACRHPVQLLQRAAGPEAFLEIGGLGIELPQLDEFSKMIAQHQTDAANSISMTALTTMSAAMNSPHTDRLWAVAVAAPEVRTEGSILVSLAH